MFILISPFCLIYQFISNADNLIQLTHSDPVHAVDVVEFIKHHLTKVQNENGGPDQFRNDWVENVDEHVLGDFAKLGVI